MNEVDRQRDHFSSIAQRYIDARKSDNHLELKSMIWQYLFNLSSVRKSISTWPAISVFEPMCGYGEGFEILKKYGRVAIVYAGADISEPMVREASSRYPGERFSVGDATQSFGNDKYDLIIIIGGLHHVFKHLPVVLENVNCALHSDGIFINFEPTEGNWLFTQIRNHIYKKNDLFDSSTERGFRLDELNGLYKSSGFEVVEQIYPGLTSYVLYYNPDAFPKLNIGPRWIVRTLFNIDKLFFRTFIGSFFAFATLSVLRKSGERCG